MRKKRRSARRKKSLSVSSIAFPIVLLVGVIVFAYYVFGGITHSRDDESCANSISCIRNLSGAFEENGQRGVFMGRFVAVPLQKMDTLSRVVLGQTSGEKRVEVDLTAQKIYAYDGDIRLYEFPVSTGKWGTTPRGEFRTWIKLRYTRMSGGSKEKGTYYNLPNVPYTMYFYNDNIPKWRGYGIHGAYWHNNFGHPMSHGCVNMRIEDAEKLYVWADPPSQGSTTYATTESPGTRVVIYGDTPAE